MRAKGARSRGSCVATLLLRSKRQATEGNESDRYRRGSLAHSSLLARLPDEVEVARAVQDARGDPRLLEGRDVLDDPRGEPRHDEVRRQPGCVAMMGVGNDGSEREIHRRGAG